MAEFLRFLAERLREPSTWRGLVWVLTACGVALKPEQVDAIIVAGMAIAGVIGVFTTEKPAKVEITMPPTRWDDLSAESERPDAMRAPIKPFKRPTVPPRPPQDAA